MPNEPCTQPIPVSDLPFGGFLRPFAAPECFDYRALYRVDFHRIRGMDLLQPILHCLFSLRLIERNTGSAAHYFGGETSPDAFEFASGQSVIVEVLMQLVKPIAQHITGMRRCRSPCPFDGVEATQNPEQLRMVELKRSRGQQQHPIEPSGKRSCQLFGCLRATEEVGESGPVILRMVGFIENEQWRFPRDLIPPGTKNFLAGVIEGPAHTLDRFRLRVSESEQRIMQEAGEWLPLQLIGVLLKSRRDEGLPLHRSSAMPLKQIVPFLEGHGH